MEQQNLFGIEAYKIKIVFKTILHLFSIFFLFLAGCAKSENKKKDVLDHSWIGNRTGEKVSYYGYDNISTTTQDVKVTVIPHTNGFAVDFQPLKSEGKYICDIRLPRITPDSLVVLGVSHKLYQDKHLIKSYLLINDEEPENTWSFFGDGFMESGTLKSCGTLTEKSRMIVVGGNIDNFTSTDPYQVSFGGVINSLGNEIKVSINP